MERTFFISDLHFNHSDIITFDKRPFKDKQHMFYSLIARWNDVVSDEDTVFILGDLAWDRDAGSIASILKKLKGKKHIVLGNHDDEKCYEDERVLKALNGGSVSHYKEVIIHGKEVVLSHYPFASFKHMHGFKGYPETATIHLYGHVHMTKDFTHYENYLENIRTTEEIPAYAFNVGAPCPWMDYTPKTLTEIVDGYYKWKNNK